MIHNLSTLTPTPQQAAFADWEFGLFIHFGLYTWHDVPGYDHKDPAWFNPSNLNCDQWIKTAAEAGMKYAVLTTKHHDGFCLWPTNFGEFSVKQSPWKNGKGDVVREFVDACRKYQVHIGLYYSPFDAYAPMYTTDAQAYDTYMLGHFKELLSNYGPIDLIWFDGCNSDGHTFDHPRISQEIRRLQPGILVFNMFGSDFRWIGNEFGFAPSNTSSAVVLENSQEALLNGKAVWQPSECDCRMRRHSWGWRAHDEHTVKSIHELMGLYYYSVGRNCNLLLNIGPNPKGLLPEADRLRLEEFGSELKRRFSNPVASFDDIENFNGRYIMQKKEFTLIDHVILQEDISKGEHVKRFSLRIHQGDPHADKNPPITIYEGTVIGHKCIVQIPPVAVMNMVLYIDEADGPVTLRNVAYYCICTN